MFAAGLDIFFAANVADFESLQAAIRAAPWQVGLDVYDDIDDQTKLMVVWQKAHTRASKNETTEMKNHWRGDNVADHYANQSKELSCWRT